MLTETLFEKEKEMDKGEGEKEEEGKKEKDFDQWYLVLMESKSNKEMSPWLGLLCSF